MPDTRPAGRALNRGAKPACNDRYEQVHSAGRRQARHSHPAATPLASLTSPHSPHLPSPVGRPLRWRLCRPAERRHRHLSHGPWPGYDLGGDQVVTKVLADQVEYYRRRAGEYDVTAYGDVAAFRARIARLAAEMRPAGSVLEIACGTGLWAEALAGWADTVPTIDAAPEMVAIARDRVRLASVSFEVADVFSWDPGTRFDMIFFSAWLSHGPASRFGQFWQLLRSLLAGNGRVLFIDEPVDERGEETYVAGQDEVVERRLGDGSTFRVIKNFVDPQELELRLRRLAWDCVPPGRQRLVYGEARLAK